MYKYEDIRDVHLEITEKCQAGCVMCARNDTPTGELLHHLAERELSYQDCLKIFEKDFIKQLTNMFMCGNFGDPIIAKDTLEVFEYFRYNNPDMKLAMYTNAGARPASWWRDLAYILMGGRRSNRPKGRVTFSVDGLEDTNHIYRENVQWDHVIRAMEAYIGAGGDAEWHFIVFKHNEHQVEEARDLARKMGFRAFIPKRTSRWNFKSSFRHLQPPDRKEFVHQINQFRKDVSELYGSWENFLYTTKISCRVQKSKSVYVTAEGLVMPCCWVGGDLYDQYNADYRESRVAKMLNGDKDTVNAKIHGLRGALESGFFDKLEKSWTAESTTKDRLRTCARVCSVDHDNFGEQFMGNYLLT